MLIAAAAAAPSASFQPIPVGAGSCALVRPACAEDSVGAAGRRGADGTRGQRGGSIRDCGGMIQQAGLSGGQIGVGCGQPGVPGEQSAEADGVKTTNTANNAITARTA